MPVESRAPSYDDLVTDLKVLREKGLIRLRTLHLPALQQAARACGESEREQHDPPAIETMLRRAVEQLGGELGEACGYLFGLVPGTRGWKPTDLRERAASLYNMQPETFRKEPEQLHVGQVAEEVLKLCHEQRLRLERVKLERRHPADSRLAIQWLDRFEAYYRLWTPISRLGDDLLAAITTRREPDSEQPPWDTEGRQGDSEDWNGIEDQAREGTPAERCTPTPGTSSHYAASWFGTGDSGSSVMLTSSRRSPTVSTRSRGIRPSTCRTTPGSADCCPSPSSKKS